MNRMARMKPKTLHTFLFNPKERLTLSALIPFVPATSGLVFAFSLPSLDGRGLRGG